MTDMEHSIEIDSGDEEAITTTTTTTTTTTNENSAIDEPTERKYRIWKKNAPFLYDYLSTNSLLWPSLTVQFFPDVTHHVAANTDAGKSAKIGDSDVISQRLLHGTFTMGQSVVDSISFLQVPTFKNLSKFILMDKLDYHHAKEEFELNLPRSAPSLSVKVLQKINQVGDVNKVRYMPQKPNVIASANNYGDLVIFERTKHKSFQKTLIDDTEVNKVQLRLSNATQPKSEIFAMDWNRNKEGLLLSGDEAGVVNLYDITRYRKSEESLNQDKSWTNKSGINDLEWFPTHDSLFAFGDESGNLKIQDTRMQPSSPATLEKQLCLCINSISLNPNFATALATGDSKGGVSIWDIRNLSQSVADMKEAHSDSITQLKWHPKYGQIIASSSTDHSVGIHDLSNIEKNVSPTIFQHLGHMLGVNDFDWSFADDWMIASVADDNSLHIWKPSHHVTSVVHTW
ncbi:uncharacterized protein LODBEIA_P24810 [Lodderomyces beijingensis]|uniref:Histone-binding protein RBBP4-like N-terminal domain-containing protein n=1 Tax=Lodderomyces beijingensis TaxID=1775926 RepID=A0ABP0ZLK7_9ASCO